MSVKKSMGKTTKDWEMDAPDRAARFPDATPFSKAQESDLFCTTSGDLSEVFKFAKQEKLVEQNKKIQKIKVDVRLYDSDWTEDVIDQLDILVDNLNKRIDKGEKGPYNVVKRNERMKLNAVDERIVKFLKEYGYIHDYAIFSPRGENKEPVFISIFMTKEDMPAKQ